MPDVIRPREDDRVGRRDSRLRGNDGRRHTIVICSNEGFYARAPGVCGGQEGGASGGDALHVKQPAVAKLERRAAMYVSNLRAYIEALGGRLSIVAEFPQGSVTITNFSDMGDDTHDA